MIQTLLFVSGINTLLQTWFGTRLPVVVGASYAFLIPAISTAFSSNLVIYNDPHEVNMYPLFVCELNEAFLLYLMA